MGNDISKRRFARGKLGEKYYEEDIWPEHEDLLEKLNIDQKAGFEIFKTFILIDTDECEKVTCKQIYEYYMGGLTGFFGFGVNKTKYTDRIFYFDQSGAVEPNNDRSKYEDEEPPALDFRRFVCMLWGYCSMSVSHLSRQLFEIYDVNRKGFLERPDIESMYRMMYDCDEHDERVIRAFPFEASGTIKRDAFVQHIKWHRSLIQPAMGFQRRVRKRSGGVILWSALASYRKKVFSGHDSEAATLEDALLSIILWQDPNKKKKPKVADAVLEEAKKKIAEEEEKKEKERQELEKQQKEEEEKKANDRDDWMVVDAWNALKKALGEFEEEYYSVDTVWERNLARAHMWSLLEDAKQVSQMYWNRREEIERLVTEGTDSDHEARLKDFLTTTDGARFAKKANIQAVLTSLLDREKKKAIARGRSLVRQTKKEIELSTALITVESCDPFVRSEFNTVFLGEEEATMLKYAKKADLEMGKKASHDLLFTWHREKVIKEMLANQEVKRGRRVAEELRIEHELLEKTGSKTTRWEYVHDQRHNRYVWVNIDTLQILPKNTAICENCDRVFAHHELQCSDCDALRSRRNAKFYYPHGARDPNADDYEDEK